MQSHACPVKVSAVPPRCLVSGRRDGEPPRELFAYNQMCCSAALILKFEGRPQDESSTHLRNKTQFGSLITKLKSAVSLCIFQRLNVFWQEKQKIMSLRVWLLRVCSQLPSGRKRFFRVWSFLLRIYGVFFKFISFLLHPNILLSQGGKNTFCRHCFGCFWFGDSGLPWTVRKFQLCLGRL